MPTLDDAKTLAAGANYEDALKMAIVVLKERDQAPPEEKANIFIFMGACYSALDYQSEAKYCYRSAQILQPDHPKIRIAMAGLGGLEASMPKELAELASSLPTEANGSAPGASVAPSDDAASPTDTPLQNPRPARTEPKDPWEDAFPVDVDSGSIRSGGGFWKWLVTLIVFAAIFWIVYEIFFRT